MCWHGLAAICAFIYVNFYVLLQVGALAYKDFPAAPNTLMCVCPLPVVGCFRVFKGSLDKRLKEGLAAWFTGSALQPESWHIF